MLAPLRPATKLICQLVKKIFCGTIKLIIILIVNFFMNLHTQIKETVKTAMKNKDATTLRTSRNILAALTNELVAQKQKPDCLLSDNDVLNVLRRLAKQRQDSIDQYHQGGRADLVAEESAELAIINSYLPPLMSREQILTIATDQQQKLSLTDKSQQGRLVGAVMKECQGQAEGNLVKEVVESLFQ